MDGTLLTMAWPVVALAALGLAALRWVDDSRRGSEPRRRSDEHRGGQR